jgi:hypothetical protein
LLFSLPLLMTMELWQIAVAVDRWRLVLLAVATIGLTVGLTRNFGATTGSGRWSATLVDAGVAGRRVCRWSCSAGTSSPALS